MNPSFILSLGTTDKIILKVDIKMTIDLIIFKRVAISNVNKSVKLGLFKLIDIVALFGE